MQKKIGCLYGVYGDQNKLVGCAFFIYTLARHILLFNVLLCTIVMLNNSF